MQPSHTPRSKCTPAAIAIPGACIARPVHGGVLHRGADNSARAQRRRIEREADRVARTAYHRAGERRARAFAAAEQHGGAA